MVESSPTRTRALESQITDRPNGPRAVAAAATSVAFQQAESLFDRSFGGRAERGGDNYRPNELIRLDSTRPAGDKINEDETINERAREQEIEWKYVCLFGRGIRRRRGQMAARMAAV